ncbi:hypothetical protein FOZ62_001128, partial [Perkinsus olseni]
AVASEVVEPCSKASHYELQPVTGGVIQVGPSSEFGLYVGPDGPASEASSTWPVILVAALVCILAAAGALALYRRSKRKEKQNLATTDDSTTTMLGDDDLPSFEFIKQWDDYYVSIGYKRGTAFEMFGITPEGLTAPKPLAILDTVPTPPRSRTASFGALYAPSMYESRPPLPQLMAPPSMPMRPMTPPMEYALPPPTPMLALPAYPYDGQPVYWDDPYGRPDSPPEVALPRPLTPRTASASFLNQELSPLPVWQGEAEGESGVKEGDEDDRERAAASAEAHGDEVVESWGNNRGGENEDAQPENPPPPSTSNINRKVASLMSSGRKGLAALGESFTSHKKEMFDALWSRSGRDKVVSLPLTDGHAKGEGRQLTLTPTQDREPTDGGGALGKTKGPPLSKDTLIASRVSTGEGEADDSPFGRQRAPSVLPPPPQPLQPPHPPDNVNEDAGHPAGEEPSAGSVESKALLSVPGGPEDGVPSTKTEAPAEQEHATLSSAAEEADEPVPAATVNDTLEAPEQQEEGLDKDPLEQTHRSVESLLLSNPLPRRPSGEVPPPDETIALSPPVSLPGGVETSVEVEGGADGGTTPSSQVAPPSPGRKAPPPPLLVGEKSQEVPEPDPLDLSATSSLLKYEPAESPPKSPKGKFSLGRMAESNRAAGILGNLERSAPSTPRRAALPSPTSARSRSSGSQPPAAALPHGGPGPLAGSPVEALVGSLPHHPIVRDFYPCIIARLVPLAPCPLPNAVRATTKWHSVVNQAVIDLAAVGKSTMAGGEPKSNGGRSSACLPSNLPVRAYRRVRSAITRARDGLPELRRRMDGCRSSSRETWEGVKTRMKYLRHGPPLKTSTGVGTEPRPCRDAVVMAAAPTEDGSPSVESLSSALLSVPSKRDEPESSLPVRRSHGTARYQRGKRFSATQEGGGAAGRNGRSQSTKVDRLVQTDEAVDESKQSYAALVDAYCSYKVEVTARILALGDKWAWEAGRLVLGRVWSAWTRWCMATEIERLNEGLRVRARQEEDLHATVEQLRRKLAERHERNGTPRPTTPRGLPQKPLSVGARELESPARSRPESPPSVGSLPAPQRGQHPLTLRRTSGVELYQGPVFVPASPRRAPVGVPRPLPAMVDASQVPWAASLDSTVNRDRTDDKPLTVESMRGTTAAFRSTDASIDRRQIGQSTTRLASSFESGVSDRATASTKSQPLDHAAHPYSFNDLLVRKVLERGREVSDRSRVKAEDFKQKLDALKRLEEAVFTKAKFTGMLS